MIKYIIATLLLFMAPIFSENKVGIGDEFNTALFKTIPDSVYNKGSVELINAIKPIKCRYWQCIYYRPSCYWRGVVVLQKGDTTYKKYADKYSSTDYFLPACHPDVCGYYIVAVIDSNNVMVYDNENIKEFIGRIDNLEEMVLTANIHGYRFSNDTIIRGSYLDCDSTYLLYVTESGYSACYCSIKVSLSKSGRFKLIENKILPGNKNDSIFDIP